ncbi:MAG: pyrroline-5-carboxylate reductase [Syntrophomonadaceae bacterium]
MILGVIGCGKMAKAIVSGIYDKEPRPYATLLVNDIDDGQAKLFVDLFQAQRGDQLEVVGQSDIVLLAVKPHQIGEVLRNTAQAWKPGQLLISVAAGVKTGFIQSCLPPDGKVVRIMPNLPALVGEGITAIAAGEGASEEDLIQVEKLLSGLGRTVRTDEKHMDAITAVSGSGPAYVMMVVEAMTEAAVHIGLDWELAKELVLTTIGGSIKMLEITGKHPAELRNQVSSPGGTTIAAVKQLEELGLRSAFYNAIEKAYHRSIQLGQE